jgi:hypothetical protein
MSTTVSILDATGFPFWKKVLSLGAHETTMLDLGQIIAEAKSREGGIRISWSGVPWAIMAQAGMEDDSTGYSATLPLTERDAASAVAFRIICRRVVACRS